MIGSVADAAVELSTGRIVHYLVSRSDPRLPGSSRWRLSPERISDQQPGQVFTELSGLDDLPLARASVRQEFLRRGRRWRDQLQEETERLRDSFQQAGDRFEERLEGWLEEEPQPSWEGSRLQFAREQDRPLDPRRVDFDPSPSPGSGTNEAWDDWSERSPESEPDWESASSQDRSRRSRGPDRLDQSEEDPWL
jgi:hypothetical protein